MIFYQDGIFSTVLHFSAILEMLEFLNNSNLGQSSDIAYFNNHLLIAINNQCHVYSLDMQLAKVLSKYPTTLIHPDAGKFMTSGGNNVCIYDAKFELISQYTHPDNVLSIQYHPSVQMAMSASKSDVYFWHSHTSIQKFKYTNVNCTHLSVDGQLACISSGNLVEFMNMQNQVVHTYSFSNPIITITSFIHNNSLHFALLSTRECHIANYPNPTSFFNIPPSQSILYHDQCLMIGSYNSNLNIYSLSGDVLFKIQVSSPIIQLAFLKSENQLSIAHINGISNYQYTFNPVMLYIYPYHFKCHHSHITINHKMRIHLHAQFVNLTVWDHHLYIHTIKYINATLSSQLHVYLHKDIFQYQFSLQVPYPCLFHVQDYIYIYNVDDAQLSVYSTNGKLKRIIDIEMTDMIPMHTKLFYYYNNNQVMKYNLIALEPITYHTVENDILSVYLSYDYSQMAIYTVDHELLLVDMDSLETIHSYKDVYQFRYNLINEQYIMNSKEGFILNGEYMNVEGTILGFVGNTLIYYTDKTEFIELGEWDLEEFDYLKLIEDRLKQFDAEPTAVVTKQTTPASIIRDYIVKGEFTNALTYIHTFPLHLQHQYTEMYHKLQIEYYLEKSWFHLITNQDVLLKHFHKLSKSHSYLEMHWIHRILYQSFEYFGYHMIYTWYGRKYTTYPIERILNACILVSSRWQIRKQLSYSLEYINIGVIHMVMGHLFRLLGYPVDALETLDKCDKFIFTRKDEQKIDSWRMRLQNSEQSERYAIKCQCSANLSIEWKNNDLVCKLCHKTYSLNKSTWDVSTGVLQCAKCQQWFDVDFEYDILVHERCLFCGE
eukprot:NODE_141_length_15967_cov_0.946118.p2 type:complete len:828 gc:universal NODE_141_length_15967_cov_0.946118:245-2728(+)